MSSSASAAARVLRIAILDDYQNLALRVANWQATTAAGGQIVVFRDTIHDEDKLVERLLPFDIICTMRERSPFRPSLISRLPNLKMLTTTGTRNRGLDVAALNQRGIPVLTAPGRGGAGTGTTEHTWALILAALKGVVRDHTAVQAGAGRDGKSWQTETNFSIEGKTLGLIGFGRLGQALLPIARALRFKLLAWSPNLTKERVAEAGEDVELASSLTDLLQRADVASLHLVSSPSTKHIISREQLTQLGPGSYLINTSRGALVDTDALVDALREKKIRGAALDVYEEEPLISGNPFEGLTNVTLTPHTAYVEDEQLEIWWQQTAENVARWIEKGDWAQGRELKQ